MNEQIRWQELTRKHRACFMIGKIPGFLWECLCTLQLYYNRSYWNKAVYNDLQSGTRLFSSLRGNRPYKPSHFVSAVLIQELNLIGTQVQQEDLLFSPKGQGLTKATKRPSLDSEFFDP